jgi:regulator of protease activity HflC (stomatin/prohibitin superfamily)
MNKIAFFATTVAITVALTGCGDKVRPGYKAKVLTPAGYSPEILDVGRHWPGFFGNLILLETGVTTLIESVPAKLSDGQDLTVEVRTRGRIAGSDTLLNQMFNSISVPKDGVLSYQQVYSIYVQPEIREGVRAAVAKYNALEVPSNYEQLTTDITNAIVERTKELPVPLESVSVGMIDYPQVVKDAIDKASARQMAIAEAKAQAEIDRTKAQARELVATAEYKAKIAIANGIADSNKIVAESLTPLLLEHRRLEVAEQTMMNVRPDETDVIYMPYETLGTPAMHTLR